MIYLYIFEDNEIRQSTSPPTPSDLACVSDGILTVLACYADEVCEINWKGIRTPIAEANTDSAGSGATLDSFHTP